MISFFVPGKPIPQGSAKAFNIGGVARVVTGARSEAAPLGGWRARIAHFASEASGEVGFRPDVAIGVTCYFYFDRPKSNKAKWPTTRRAGDLDKLERAVLDGLTGVLFSDDSQVVTIVGEKCWTGGKTPGPRIRNEPGVYIEVWEKQ
jgi:Holliday junction resolvase RusA-like endonuclease